MVEVGGVEDVGGEALDKLVDAVGQPTSRALENAKALFPFIAHETVMNGDASATPDGGLPGSADRHPAAPAGRA
ncbi:hypothetical protein [Streptomyces sp. NPDC054854]